MRETAKDEVAAYIHSITEITHHCVEVAKVRDNWLTTKKGQPGLFVKQGARQVVHRGAQRR